MNSDPTENQMCNFVNTFVPKGTLKTWNGPKDYIVARPREGEKILT